MRTETKDAITDLRFMLEQLESDGPALEAVHEVVRATLDLLDCQTNAIVAATSIIACVPGNRYVVGFANDVIEASHKALSALEAIDRATTVLLKPIEERHEAIGHSLKAAN